MKLGGVIKILIVLQEETQSSIAIKLKMSNSYLCEIIRNKKKCSMALLKKITALFNIPAWKLIKVAETIEEKHGAGIVSFQYMVKIYLDIIGV